MKKITKSSTNITEDRYKAIMDVIPESEREKGFLYYSDDDIYEIGEDIAYNVKLRYEDLDEESKEKLRRLREIQNWL